MMGMNAKMKECMQEDSKEGMNALRAYRHTYRETNLMNNTHVGARTCFVGNCVRLNEFDKF